MKAQTDAAGTPAGCIADAQSERQFLLGIAYPGLRQSHSMQRKMNKAHPEAADLFRGSQPNVRSRECRINPYGVATRDPDSDAHSAADGAVRLRACNTHIRITSQPKSERKGAQEHCQSIHQKELRSRVIRRSRSGVIAERPVHSRRVFHLPT